MSTHHAFRTPRANETHRRGAARPPLHGLFVPALLTLLAGSRPVPVECEMAGLREEEKKARSGRRWDLAARLATDPIRHNPATTKAIPLRGPPEFRLTRSKAPRVYRRQVYTLLCTNRAHVRETGFLMGTSLSVELVRTDQRQTQGATR